MKIVKALDLKVGDLFAINPDSELLGEVVGIELIGKESIIIKEQWFSQKTATNRQCSRDYLYYTQDSIFGDEDAPCKFEYVDGTPFNEYPQIVK